MDASHSKVSEEVTKSWGKIQLFTGDGKGKTTAALGTAMRAFISGKKVAFVFFDKGGEDYAETKLLQHLKIPFFRTGLNRIDPSTRKFRFGVTPEDQAEGERGLNLTRNLLKAELNLLVLDEIVISAALGIIQQNSILEILAQKPPELEMILTGRHASPEIRYKADLITEMTLVKHYFYEGHPARPGLDY